MTVSLGMFLFSSIFVIINYSSLHLNLVYANSTRFRKRVRDIEIIVDNLVAAAFENVKNVEEGIDVLWATYQYAKRPNLKNLFQKKTFQVS